MNKLIIELITGDQSAKAVAVVEKALASKLRKAIVEHTSEVARETYGTLAECFGGDEQPEFMNPGDNAYAVFYANALKKFGVNGPHDFTDEGAKQQFFQYIDNNWKAQDSVQATTAPVGVTTEVGTQTQLPPTAPTPQPPVAAPPVPMPDNNMASIGNDPSTASLTPPDPAMNPSAGAGIAQQAGNIPADTSLNQTQADQSGAAPQPHVPPVDLDNDPDLEIGDDDQADPDPNDLNVVPDDEMPVDGGDPTDPTANADSMDDASGEDGLGADTGLDGVDVEGDDTAGPTEDGSDDPFDDEDAYNVTVADFGGSDDLSDDADGGSDDSLGGNPDIDADQEPNLEIGDEDDSVDEDGLDDESDIPDTDGDGEVTDADVDDASTDDIPPADPKLSVKKPADTDEDEPLPTKKKESKPNPFAKNEDFGAGLDDAEDKLFIKEVLDPIAATAAKGSDLEKKVAVLKKNLQSIKKQRNMMLKTLKQERAAIMADATKTPEQKQAAKQQIAAMGKENMKHFRTQAGQLKALATGKN